MEAVFVQVIPHFALNVYSPPSDQRQTFRCLLRKETAVAKHSPLIVAGDFNTPQNAWGCETDRKRRESGKDPGRSHVDGNHGPSVPDQAGHFGCSRYNA
ncbi:hypothetical protein MTO96_038932 [Rhipicephalus appendiculatus]